MVTIYKSYENEPKDIFEDLDESTYSIFYDIEMSNFTDDLTFYSTLLPAGCSVLELGCGTGRLSQLLINDDHNITGVDLSKSMLAHAKNRCPHLNAVCMDIRDLQFACNFDAVIAPYNVLNLLAKQDDLNRCLQASKKLLTPNGKILAEITTIQPDSELAQKKKSFQFQIFDSPNLGRLIKEVKRNYIEEQQCIEVKERYRLRPKNGQNRDYCNTYTINAYSYETWTQIFTTNGFSLINAYQSYDLVPYDSSKNHLLAVLQPQP